MIFETDGNTYCVKFSRAISNPEISSKPTTFATLYIKEGDNFIFAGFDGRAVVGEKDKFNKSTGRKVALTKLLKKLTFLTKEDRTRIWLDIYFKEHKK